MNTDADILDRAADIIEANGFHQGAYWPGYADESADAWSPGKPVCVTGAIAVARGHGKYFHLDYLWYSCDPAVVAFAEHLGFDGDALCVPTWNDDPLRTKAGVIRSLREAAKRNRDGDLAAPRPEVLT